MDDIEDIAKNSFSSLPPEVSEVLPRQQSRASNHEKPMGNIPGTQTVYLKTQGCAHNISDSEYMAGLLASYGYRITEKLTDNPDIYLFNSCTVKGPSQDSFLHSVRNAKLSGKPVVVAGCVPQGQPTHEDLDGLSVVGVQQIHRVVEVVEEALKGHTVRLLSQRTKPSLDLPKIRCNPYIEVIPISTGCLNHCTYCKTKHARGDLGSYELSAIVNRALKVVNDEGVLEVRLTSEDTGAYGRDIGTNLPTLMKTIADQLPEGAMLRVGMTNPPYILEHIDAVADLLNHPRVFGFLHIPVQSGSDPVLEKMKREYTAADFCTIMDILSQKVPGVSLATDIICGFPTETEEDFDKTMELMAKYRMPFINISQFYPRPGTPAARMKRISTAIVKARSRRLTDLVMSFTDCFHHLLGTTQEVWICGEKSSDAKFTLGHTKNYVQVMLPIEGTPVAGRVMAEITEVQRWCALAKVVSILSVAPPPPANTAADFVVHADNGDDNDNENNEGKEDNDDDDDEGCCGDGPCDCKETPPPKVKNGIEGVVPTTNRSRTSISKSKQTAPPLQTGAAVAMSIASLGLFVHLANSHPGAVAVSLLACCSLHALVFKK